MKHKDFDFKGDSRLNQRSKRRKTNLILNSLIVLVLLLIIIVSVTIFFGGSNESSSPKEDTKHIESKDSNQSNQEESNVDNQEDDSDNTTVEEDVDSDSDSTSSDSESDETSTENNSETESDAVVTEGGSDPNVKATITNPDWQPVGTSQSGEHATVYDQNSTDWQEMLHAISYATGVDQSNMTVWFLGRNNESGSQSIATISSKDQSKIYRVVIEWVDGQGWKPLQAEELLENDRR